MDTPDYVKDLKRDLRALRKTLKFKMTRKDPKLKKIKTAVRLAKDVRIAVAGASRNIGGLNFNRETTFLFNGMRGFREGVEDRTITHREGNRAVEGFRAHALKLIKAIKEQERRIQLDAKNNVESDMPPWEDFNPKPPERLKFDEMRAVVQANNEFIERKWLETQERLKEDAKPLTDEKSEGARKQARLNEALLELSDLTHSYEQEFLPKLPRRIKAEDKYKLVRLPVVCYTKNPLSDKRLRDARTKYHELYPGYILEKQYLLALPKGTDLDIHDSFQFAIRDLEASTGMKFVEPQEGYFIGNHYVPRTMTTLHIPKVLFVWLMPAATFNKLETPAIQKAQLAFSEKVENIVHTDLSKLSRELLLGKMSERYDPDNFDTKLFALDQPRKEDQPPPRFRVVKMPVIAEPETGTFKGWSPTLSFSITKVSEKQIILENQLVVVVKKADYNSALFHSSKFQEKILRNLQSKHRNKLPVINPLDGMAITTSLNPECVYIWLMPVREYETLGKPRFVRFGFPFSGGSFTSGNEKIDARHKKVAKQLNKLEKKLRKQHPRWYALMRGFQERAKDVDRQTIVLEKRMEAFTLERHALQQELASRPANWPHRHLIQHDIERLAQEVLKLEAQLQELKANRKMFHDLAVTFDERLEAERSALKAEFIKHLRA